MAMAGRARAAAASPAIYRTVRRRIGCDRMRSDGASHGGYMVRYGLPYRLQCSMMMDKHKNGRHFRKIEIRFTRGSAPFLWSQGGSHVRKKAVTCECVTDGKSHALIRSPRSARALRHERPLRPNYDSPRSYTTTSSEVASSQVED